MSRDDLKIRVEPWDGDTSRDNDPGIKDVRLAMACNGLKEKGDYENEGQNWVIKQKTGDRQKDLESLCGKLGGKRGKKARKSKKSRKSKRKSKKQKKKTRKSRK